MTSDAPQQDRPAEGPPGGRRDNVVDRRTGLDRRELARLRGEEPSSTGLERRRGPGRRRSDFMKSAEEGEMTSEQFLFLQAIEAFKRVNRKTYPSWTDVLEVVRLLGYRKTCPSEIQLRNVEDWKEKPDAPSNVKAGHRDEFDDEGEGDE